MGEMQFFGAFESDEVFNILEVVEVEVFIGSAVFFPGCFNDIELDNGREGQEVIEAEEGFLFIGEEEAFFIRFESLVFKDFVSFGEQEGVIEEFFPEIGVEFFFDLRYELIAHFISVVIGELIRGIFAPGAADRVKITAEVIFAEGQKGVDYMAGFRFDTGEPVEGCATDEA